MATERLLASLGSALANCTLFGAVIAGWPGLPAWTATAYAQPRETPVVIRMEFRPYIVDPAMDSWNGPRRARCPQPAVGTGQFELLDAPLPARFDPAAWPTEQLYACVRVNDAGKVQAVSLIGLSEPAVAAAVTGKVRRDWVFSPGYVSEQGWAKVRINAGPPEAPSMPPPQTY
jgi:hypothetical protein